MTRAASARSAASARVRAARGPLLLAAAVLSAAACAKVLGIRPPEQRAFEHRAHVVQGLACSVCHAGVEKAGESGPLHLPSKEDCVRCHREPHDDADCGGCHGVRSTRDGAAFARAEILFEHARHQGRAAGSCVRCHADVGRDAEVLRPGMASCGSCHPHDGQLAKTQCDACHLDLREEGTQPSDHLVHAGDFVRDHGPRAAASREACASCHAERFCGGCHAGSAAPAPPERLAFDDPRRGGVHRAGFLARHAEEARGDPGLCTTCHAPSACQGCHEQNRLAPSGPGARRNPHPPGWLGLPGQPNDHGRAAFRDPGLCASCHGGAGEALCVACHKVGGVGGSPHAPGWSSRRRPKIERPCRACHGGP